MFVTAVLVLDVDIPTLTSTGKLRKRDRERLEAMIESSFGYSRVNDDPDVWHAEVVAIEGGAHQVTIQRGAT